MPGDSTFPWSASSTGPPVERDQVLALRRLSIELSQHRSDLTAVKRRVIDHMLQRVPEDRFNRRAAEVCVMNHAINAIRSKSVDEIANPSFLLGPASAHVLHRLEIRWREMRARRIALPAGTPRPFGRHKVHECVPDRREAVPKILMELIMGKPLGRSEQTVASPVVIVQQALQRFRRHGQSISDVMGWATPSHCS